MLLVNPLAGAVTSRYDLERVHPKLERVVPHLGTDIGGRPRGGRHPIVAAAAGRVIYVRTDSWAGDRRGGYLPRLTGRQVVLEHDDLEGRSFLTYYGHLDEIKVHEGQTIKAGQVLGTQGATGDVDGAHLHLEVWLDGVPVDPDQFFRTHGVPLGTGPTTPTGALMAKLDPDDYTAIATAVWGHGPKERRAWDVLDRTNQAAGRMEKVLGSISTALDALEKIVRAVPGAVWSHLTPSGRPAGEVIDKTNHAAGRLEAAGRTDS